jgi:hypothetical protein
MYAFVTVQAAVLRPCEGHHKRLDDASNDGAAQWISDMRVGNVLEPPRILLGRKEY